MDHLYEIVWADDAIGILLEDNRGLFERSGIRIHTGTIPEHSKGCILMTPKGVNVITELLTKYENKNEKVYLRISDGD